MIFREIAFESEDYRQECVLRNLVLRIPLGLSLYDEDLGLEKTQLHFGLFDDSGRLVGCVVAVPLSPCEAKIRQMAVGPDCQGKGNGRSMIYRIEDHLERRGFTRLCLHARTTAVGFYEKMCYKKTGAEFVEVGIPHVRMEKILAQSPRRDEELP